MYTETRLGIDQDMVKSLLAFLNSQTCLDGLVSFSCFSFSKDFLWLAYLSLNELAVMPMYSLEVSSFVEVTSAL